MISNRLLVICLLVPSLVMCTGKRDNALTDEQIREAEQALVGANRVLLKKDKARIIQYIDSNNLNLKETETGLWFEVIKAGTGPVANPGSRVTIDYRLSLLDGTMCYNSDSLGFRQFRVGQGGIESGLDEGIRILTEGSEALFILPPHLAHGLTGDGNCIPARAVIVYYVKLISVEP